MTFVVSSQPIDWIISPATKSARKVLVSIVFLRPIRAAANVVAKRSQDYAPWYAGRLVLKTLSPLDIPVHLRDGPYLDAAVVNQKRGYLALRTRSFPFLFPLVLHRGKRDINFFTKTFTVSEAEESQANFSVNSEDPYVEYEDESDRYFEYTLKFLEPGYFVSQIFATKKWKDVPTGHWKRAVQLIGQFLLDLRYDVKIFGEKPHELPGDKGVPTPVSCKDEDHIIDPHLRAFCKFENCVV
ncbi:unnamed protein product [Schistocephalus solidus]|uniref:CIA30 domain-containing protein n=1 Tax=Schistocephalus solidus TaxID=70667 RepID=A0A183SD73_SCHSO|nr:unnamed protein product [Schistocephalus solidus]